MVEGRTSVNAVVTVNGEALEVSAGGYSSAGVRPPDRGDNTIEIVARSPEGEELVEVRTVTWAPTGRPIYW